MNPISRALRRFTQSDEERLAEEVRGWADSVSGTTRIGDCPCRRQVQIAGVVSRMTVRTLDGADSLEAVVSDGTGEVTARWMGRSNIPGLDLGTRVILEGVLSQEREALRMYNPKLELG